MVDRFFIIFVYHSIKQFVLNLLSNFGCTVAIERIGDYQEEFPGVLFIQEMLFRVTVFANASS